MKTTSVAYPGFFSPLSVALKKSGLFLILCTVLISAFVTGCKKKTEPEPDKPPVVVVVNINPTGTLGTAVTLDGSGSTDPENKALTYSWTIKSQPPGSTATITNPGSMVAGLVPDKPGTYVLVLTVTDANKQSKSIEVTINVVVPGRPPVANAGPSGTISTNRRIALDGSKSSDPDGDKLTYKWEFKSKPTGSAATILNADKAVAEFTADLLGPYVLTLTVSDGNWPSVSAEATITAVVPATREITGSWTAADGTGGGNEYTPRNHFYTLDVAANNQPLSLSLTSTDINVGFYVYDPNGEVVDRFGSGFGRNQPEDAIVNAGKYTVMVCSGQRYDIGSYVLKGRGLSSEFMRVPALRAKSTDVSFGTEGGGGNEKTSRNHYYTFDVVSDNAITDINAQSPEIPLWMTLSGPSGAEVRYTFVGTPRYMIEKLNKGSYSLWVGSGTRDAIGKYTLDIFGQVQNLKQYVFESSILTDDYRGKNANTMYTLNVTENNTLLDVSLRSPDIVGAFTIYDPNGNDIGYSFNGNYRALVREARKGQYKILVQPASNTSGIGKYTLSVYGKFADLKKQ